MGNFSGQTVMRSLAFAIAAPVACILLSACTIGADTASGRTRMDLASGLVAPVLLVEVAEHTELAQAAEEIPATVRDPATDDRDAANNTDATDESSDADLLFAVMLAEMAMQAGDYENALAGYRLASERSGDPRISEQAARLAAYGNRWDLARDMALRWLDLDPDALDARFILAAAMRESGDLDASIELLLDTLVMSDDRELHIREVQSALASGSDADAAIATMQAIREAYPDSIEAQLGLARAAMFKGDLATAMSATDEALALDADNTDALESKYLLLRNDARHAQALLVLEKLIERSGAERRDLAFQRLELLELLGRDEALAQALDALYAEVGQEPQALLFLAQTALRARLDSRAENWYAALLTYADTADQAQFALGTLAEEGGRLATAIERYAAVQAGPFRVRAAERRAELMAREGDIEGALGVLDELTDSLDEPLPSSDLLVTRAHVLQQGERAEEAYELLSQGLQQNPDDAVLLYARALLADSLGRSEELERDLGRLIEAEPENAHALNALGYHYVSKDIELERADELLSRASSLEPEDPAIMDSLGWLRFRQQRYIESIRLLEQALSRYPDGEIAAHLGEVLWSDGQTERARKVWRNALQRDPENRHVLETIDRLKVALEDTADDSPEARNGEMKPPEGNTRGD